MAEFQIKAEKLPVRCEVCHQSDCFDPKTNHCSRCAKAMPPKGPVRSGLPFPHFLVGWMRQDSKPEMPQIARAILMVVALIAGGGLFNHWTMRWNSHNSHSRPNLPVAPVRPVLQSPVYGVPSPASSIPTFAILGTKADRDNIKALGEVLADDASTVTEVETLEEATESEADILILLMESSKNGAVSADTLDSLKSRKVIGIGYGAAQLFGKLGLEINADACAHSGSLAPDIKIETGRIMKQENWSTFTPFNRSPAAGNDNFAMYIPRKSYIRSIVDVIARWDKDENYAPIVRQGNFILSGLAAPAADWTPEYKSFFSQMAAVLHSRAPEPFSRASWGITDPGTYSFKLAKGSSTTELPDWNYYFRFTRATTFSARLEHTGSSNVSLLFMGEGRQHWIRKDARRGEPLEISVNITDADIEAMGDGYWKLKVVNFDTESRVDCSLKIEYGAGQGMGPEEKPLIAPRLLSPADGAVFDLYPRKTTLRWAPVPGALSYTLEIDCYQCCSTGKWCSDVQGQGRLETVRTTSFTFDFVGAQPGRWRVWAIGENGEAGPKSDWREFRYTR